jgi:ribonucleotide reductase class II
VPAQKDTDEEGNLLNDPFDPRCTEWLVEIPVEVSWANLEGCDSVNTDQFSVKAQFDFFMQVQNHYTTHNTSATLEYRESEIAGFAELLHDNITSYDGYMSAAMMARFDANQEMHQLVGFWCLLVAQ